MNKWNVPTTAEAIAEAKKRSEIVHGRSVYVGTGDYQQRRSKLMNVINNFSADLYCSRQFGFDRLMEVAYPIWRDELIHEKTKNSHIFMDWVGNDYVRNMHRDIYTFLEEFFANAYGQSDEVVNNWINRINAIIHTTYTLSAVMPKLYMGSQSLADIEKLWHSKGYFWHLIHGLERGFTVKELLKISSTFYIHPVNFTPDDLRVLYPAYPYRTINNMLKIFSLHTLDPNFTFDEFFDLLNVGFTRDKELRAFIRNVGFDYSTPHLFTEVVKLRKKLTDEEMQILIQSQPNILELSKILVKHM